MAHASEAAVKDELKIVRWIQFMRCAEHALQKVFSARDWKQIVEEASFKRMYIDENDDQIKIEEIVPSEQDSTNLQDSLKQPLKDTIGNFETNH